MLSRGLHLGCIAVRVSCSRSIYKYIYPQSVIGLKLCIDLNAKHVKITPLGGIKLHAPKL